MLFDYFPEGPWLGGPRRSFVHHRGGAVGEGAVNDVAVARDPAHIGRAPVDVVLTDVEDPLEGEVGPEVVARRGVDHPLGFAGGAGGVKHEQPVFAGHRFGRAFRALAVHQVMPPQISARFHRGRFAGTAHDQHMLHRGTDAAGQGLIHCWFEGHRLVLAEATIGGDHRLGVSVDQAIPQGFSRKASEHNRVGSPNAGTGQHGDGRLGHHRHVQSDQISLANTQAAQGIGGLANLGVQLAVAEAPLVPRLPLPDQGQLVGPGALQVAIEAVVGEIGGAPLKPAGRRRVTPIEHLLKGGEPVQLLASPGPPEGIWVRLRFRHQGPIGLDRADAGLGGEGGRGLEATLLVQHRFDAG